MRGIGTKFRSPAITDGTLSRANRLLEIQSSPIRRVSACRRDPSAFHSGAEIVFRNGMDIDVVWDVGGAQYESVRNHAAEVHEHFRNPVVVRSGCYLPPTEPGYSSEMIEESLADYRFPSGRSWA